MLNEMRAKVFVPDGTPVSEALARTTHLAVSAHQDDIEIMAYDGISGALEKRTNGSLPSYSQTVQAARGAVRIRTLPMNRCVR